MPKCLICLADINRMERVTHPLFISAATLQSFNSEELLARHTAQLYKHLSKAPLFGVQHQQQQQQQQQQPGAAAALQAGVAAGAAAGPGWAGSRQQQ
ncbi:hypothetical protein OEZ85_004561 [Tetradesmus obliquus]|uniref:Uncharacterized protein n=1 Tax=Tetradesmus obliquus TaxID=3088 RepID=A0ABY8UMK4_TETOB|nr:hypothetical protein OEZ85_004561 [Tetradesmus obliquus]